MSFFNTKCISTCITFFTNPLQTCLLTPYFLQNVLAHFKHLKLVQKSILSLKIGAIFHFKNLNSVANLILKALKWPANLILNLKPFKILKPYGDP